jgi:predicted alpha/beta-hydrolase family hydrolase
VHGEMQLGNGRYRTARRRVATGPRKKSVHRSRYGYGALTTLCAWLYAVALAAGSRSSDGRCAHVLGGVQAAALPAAYERDGAVAGGGSTAGG